MKNHRYLQGAQKKEEEKSAETNIVRHAILINSQSIDEPTSDTNIDPLILCSRPNGDSVSFAALRCLKNCVNHSHHQVHINSNNHAADIVVHINRLADETEKTTEPTQVERIL